MKINLFGYCLQIYRKGVRNWTMQPGHEMKLAFVHNGEEYYTFVNPIDMYCKRYFAALDAILMNESGLDQKFVKIFFESAKAYYDKGKHSDVMVLIQNLYQRSAYVTNDELFLTLCAVVFVDKNENPYDYNIEYAETKKAKWRRDSELLGKFFPTLQASYFPLFDTSKMSIQEYLTAARIEELTILRSHQDRLSKIAGSDEALKIIKSRIAELLP